MDLIEKKVDCCGCTACENICPVSAISMTVDEEGFLYPFIDANICIECGLCKKVCVFQTEYMTPDNFEKPLVYAVRHKDENELAGSRSGAVFVALSDYILKNNGVVYGAGFNKQLRVIHKRASTKMERDEFRGSKYVQSDPGESFKMVRNDLENNIPVLYSGTPCCTAGLIAYLKETGVNTDQLYVCDIVCHGTPSPFIWRDYVSYVENVYRDRVVKANFRDKDKGWVAHFESFVFEKKNKKIYKKIFAQLFNQHVMFRPCCGKCKYTNFQRPADVTLADYWGWEKVSTAFNSDNKGVSLVLVNTQKGRRFFEYIRNDIVCLESSTEQCLQPNLQHPSIISPKRDMFWNDYKKYGFLFVAKKYKKNGLKKRMDIMLLRIKVYIKRKMSK